MLLEIKSNQMHQTKTAAVGKFALQFSLLVCVFKIFMN